MIDKKNIEDIYPLSDNQMTFLLNHISSMGNDSGQILVKCKLKGSLDQAIFTRAWHAIVQKHSSMRSSVHWKNLQRPLQVVYKQGSPQISFIDGTSVNGAQGKSLQLDQQPNHLVTVSSLGDNQHMMIWNCHHIFIDGWSTSIVLDDFITIYNSLISRTPVVAVSRQSRQFKDYLNWLKTCDMDEARIHWLKSSQSEQAGKNQPFESITNYESSKHCLHTHLQPQIVNLIRGLSDQNAATLSEIVQSAWSIFLTLLSQSSRTSFIVTLSGRSSPLAGIESIVGQLSTALPLEIQIMMTDSLIDVLKKVRSENNVLRKYDYLSMLQLGKWGYRQASLPQVKINNKPHDVSSLVVVENFTAASKSDNSDSGLQLVSFESDIVSNFPLTLIVLSGDTEVTLKLLSNSSAFGSAVTRQIFESFESLFIHLLEHPGQAISDCRQIVSSHYIVEPDLPASADLAAITETIVKRAYKPPHTEIQDHLQKIWQDIFTGNNKISIDENFFDLGGTSLDVISMYSRIESRFDCNLPISSIIEAPTIEKLAALVSQQPEEINQVIVPVQTQGKQLPIFGIHAQDILFYRDISNALGDQQPFYAVQQLENDSADDFSHASIAEMAASYIDEIKKIQDAGPYAIIGLCMGCTIGQEIARQLAESGEKISALIMLDPDMPEMVFRKKPAQALSLANIFSVDRLFGLTRMFMQKLLRLPVFYQLALIKGRLRIARKSLSGPLEKRRAIRRHHNWLLNQKHMPKLYAGKILVIQSGQYHQSMSRYFNNGKDDFDSSNNVQTEVIEGSHANIFSPPKVYTTATLISHYIQQNQS